MKTPLSILAVNLASVLVFVSVRGSVVLAQQGPAPAGPGAAAQEPAPPPGSPGTYKSQKELMEVLTKASANAGGMTTSAVSNTKEYRINIVHRAKPAGAIAHPGNTELHYIIDGSATIVTGGTIVRAAGANLMASIDNGVARHVSKGDVIIIPPNSAHWYKDIEATITYLEVRFVAPPK